MLGHFTQVHSSLQTGQVSVHILAQTHTQLSHKSYLYSRLS